MINKNKALQAWVKIDGNGNVVPGSLVFRPFPFSPKDGKWKKISGNVCCPNSGDINGYVLFKNTTASANITYIRAGGYIWTGTLTNGQSLIIPLFDSYDYHVHLTVDTPSGRTITTAVLQGGGTITAGGVITNTTNTYNTSATANGQYSITLS